LGVHDPSTIIKCKDKYYVFSTSLTGGIVASKASSDKIFWTSGPDVFAAAPAWVTNSVPGLNRVFGAPDIISLNGQYYLYYVVTIIGTQASAIGLASNPTLDPSDPAYQWTDRGPVLQSSAVYPYNALDPSLTRDAAGNLWMSFGSYWGGIYLVQLDPATGLRISANSPIYHLASNSSIEASCLFRRGGYYYLFVNWGSCCVGVPSTYNIRVGQSTAITGPYLDRAGVDMASGGGTLFLEGTGKFTGPGQIAILSEGGNQWFSYHYYDANAWFPGYNAYGAPVLGLAPLSWTADNWPVFTNDWSAVYNFQADARDDNGQYYGLLLNGASITNDSAHGRVLNLNGTNQYVWLPPGVANARTFSAVVKWKGGGAWQRVFDFGNDTSSYVMLTPSSDGGTLRCDIRAAGVTQTLAAPSALATGVWTHVVLTLDGYNGVLYVNGAPVAAAPITISPSDVHAQTNHLGHSKFAADPDFKGQIAAFRVYGRALTAVEIAAPVPTIFQPAEGASYWPGQQIAFNGAAADFLGLSLNSTNLSWRVDYIVDSNSNCILGPLLGVTNGVFTIPTNVTTNGLFRLSLTATDGSNRQSTVTATLSAANPPTAATSYYPFRVDASDANGHYPGILNNGASIQLDSTRGNVLNLSGTNQYVSLPAGAAGFQTFMAWVKWNGGASWQRICDFGNDENTYAIITPSAGNGRLRFSISLNDGAGEQVIDGLGPLPIGVWTHVAVVTDGNTGILFTNGTPVATNAFLNLVPQNLCSTNNYLGKSQWPDPYFNGRISSLRLISRPLSSSEVTAPNLAIAAPAQGSLYNPGDTIAFSGSASDFYDAPIAATGLTWSVEFRYVGATNTVYGPAAGLTNGTFSIPLTGAASTNGYYHIVLSAADPFGRRATNTADIFPASAAASSDWASFYPFNTSAQDSSNRFNGTLNNGASVVTDTTRGKVLNLNGLNQYVSLPAGAGSAETLAGWVKWNGGAVGQRIFDFGQDTAHWFHLVPANASGNLEGAITTEAGKFVQSISAPWSLPAGVWTHVALVLDGRQGILYTNGQAVAVNQSVNLLPSDVAPAQCYLGRSQYISDPFFNGRLNAVQLNSRPLSIQAITAPVAAIIQPEIGSRYAGGGTIAFAGTAVDYSNAPLPPADFAWSAEFHHDGIVDPGITLTNCSTNGTFLVPLTSPASTNVFYRLQLTVNDTMGNQATISRNIPPSITTLSFDTVPSGLQFSFDAQPLTGPTNIPAVAGMTRLLSVSSPQSYASSNYNFMLWSDGGAQTHGISVPLRNATYLASFVQPKIAIQSAATTLILAWPAWAGSLQLSTATNLTPPVSWTAATNTPVNSNDLMIVSLRADQIARFYRLQSQ
jgi:arabinan endo-1,5-alpha-L-arabinosidase